MFVFALLIKIQDGGPITFSQERWGKVGKKFKVYKFRTMVPDADKKYGFSPARENDIRITFLGKILRATAMDELPQLINILKGDMSFVGPRALAVAEISTTHPLFYERHKIRPGLTGPAQIGLARDVPFEVKLGHDLDYIQKVSISGDIQYLLQSLWITLFAGWEKRSNKSHKQNEIGRTIVNK